MVERMIGSERNLHIREMEDGDEFVHWLAELIEQHPSHPGVDAGAVDKHLVLTNEIGDWIGGVRYILRGGVAHLLEIGIAPHERGQGHSFRLLTAFEESARSHMAHLAEFWTDDLGGEALLSALGWRLVLTREGYIGGRTWHLLEKHLL